MEIPALLYGSYADVKTRCRRLWKQYLKEHQSPLELFEAGGMLETRVNEGKILFKGPNPTYGAAANYQCFAPLRVLVSGLPAALEAEGRRALPAVLEVFVARPWGLLCLLDSNNMTASFGIDRLDFCRHFVRASLTYWDNLVAEEPRYDNGGETLWHWAHPLRQALYYLGVPQEILISHRNQLPHSLSPMSTLSMPVRSSRMPEACSIAHGTPRSGYSPRRRCHLSRHLRMSLGGPARR